MRAWEIRQKKAAKRARELARKEKRRAAKASEGFRLLVLGRESEATVVESVIVKKPDESVAEATFDEVTPEMILIIEGERGLIERAVVDQKIESAEGGSRELRVRAIQGS